MLASSVPPLDDIHRHEFRCPLPTSLAILFVASDEPTLKALALYQKHGKLKTGETVRLY